MKKEQKVLNVTNDENKSFDTLIEEKRVPLYKEFQQSRKISNILTILILVISIAGMYFITGKESWQPFVGWAILIAGVVGMVVFYFLSKKKFETNTREYITFVNNTINDLTFNGEEFENIVETDTKMEIADFAGNGVYNDIVRVASRNIINGTYLGKEFKYVEAAIFKKGPSRKQPAVASFVGKFIDIPNSLEFDGNFVINISREEPIDTPNAIDGMSILYSGDSAVVYGDEGADFRKAIGEEFFGNIKKIKAENHLLNLAVSIYGGHTFVFMSYDDDVIAMPFDKGINAEAITSFTADLKIVFKAISMLGK